MPSAHHHVRRVTVVADAGAPIIGTNGGLRMLGGFGDPVEFLSADCLHHHRGVSNEKRECVDEALLLGIIHQDFRAGLQLREFLGEAFVAGAEGCLLKVFAQAHRFADTGGIVTIFDVVERIDVGHRVAHQRQGVVCQVKVPPMLRELLIGGIVGDLRERRIDGQELFADLLPLMAELRIGEVAAQAVGADVVFVELGGDFGVAGGDGFVQFAVALAVLAGIFEDEPDDADRDEDSDGQSGDFAEPTLLAVIVGGVADEGFGVDGGLGAGEEAACEVAAAQRGLHRFEGIVKAGAAVEGEGSAGIVAAVDAVAAGFEADCDDEVAGGPFGGAIVEEVGALLLGEIQHAFVEILAVVRQQ